MKKEVIKYMNERIKALRKELELNQAEFGEKIGVSRSVIANIELNRVEPKELLVKHICDIFNVNEQWLLNGSGEMFTIKPTHDKSLDELLNLYQGLKPEFQEYVLQQIDRLRKLQDSGNEG